MFSIDFYHLKCLIQVLLVCSSVNNARLQLHSFWSQFLQTIEGIGIFRLSVNPKHSKQMPLSTGLFAPNLDQAFCFDGTKSVCLQVDTVIGLDIISQVTF